MLSTSPDSQIENGQQWLKYAFLDEPGLRSLNEFVCRLTSTRELHEALRLIGEEVRAFLSARFVAVVVLDDDQPSLDPEGLPLGTPAVPLRLAGRTVGHINIYFDRPRALTASESKVMEVIAAVAAVTLDNAKLLQRERKRLVQAETINALAPSLAAAGDRQDLARRAVNGLHDLLHYDAARLLWRDELGKLICVAESSANGRCGEDWRDGDVASRALLADSAVLITDVDSSVDASLRSLLAVPLRTNRGTVGVVEIGARSPRAFDNADLTALSALAAQVSTAAERLASSSDYNAGASRSDAHDLLSLLAHDLRGPLSLVKGYASTLSRLGDSLEGEKRRRFLTGIGDAADRLSVMIDHLVGVSHIESGRFRGHLTQTDLSKLVTETVDRIRPQLGERPISLELPGKALPVQVDREHVGRAFSELLLHFARESETNKSRISIRLGLDQSPIVQARESMDGDPSTLPYSAVAGNNDADYCGLRDHIGRYCAIVEVRDDSFPPHSDPVASRSGGVSSRSLELYVARKTIEAHGGRLWAENEPSRGLNCGFYLPLTL